jgi:UDP-N-acetylmuramoylalanine--D-glutamate ligase
VNIIELSSYQLEVTPSLRSDIAVIMNITPDHLDRHGGMQGYITAKEQVLASLAPEGLAILGEGEALDNFSKKYEEQLHISRLADDKLVAEASHIKSFNNLALKGMHNAQNCLAARSVCRALGLSDTQIDAGIESFSGLPHRLQPAGQIDNILFVNDSKATNGEAAAHALASFDNIHWCAGGIAKEDGLEACLPHLEHVVQSYLYGACANDFATSLQGLVPVSCFETLEEAIKAASASAQKSLAPHQQVILLSPAAASFDQFPSFEARGQHFCALAAAQVAKHVPPPASDSFGGRHV